VVGPEIALVAGDEKAALAGFGVEQRGAHPRERRAGLQRVIDAAAHVDQFVQAAIKREAVCGEDQDRGDQQPALKDEKGDLGGHAESL